MTIIKNVEGTSNLTCACDNWLVHWRNHSNITSPKACCVNGCKNAPEVGAHIHKMDMNFGICSIMGFKPDCYIVPMCTHHNNQRGAKLEIAGSTIFVSSNPSNTCKKTHKWWHCLTG
jgi:hypothetical protein